MTVPYRATFYAPLALLHAAVALRLAGDALGAAGAVRLGGALAAAALAAFIVVTVHAVATGRRGASA